ncbi:CPBP family intramembrane metalloprotease [Paenibacillus sp. ACRRX]|uniref:CPBP family intramembrane glutamic endopeptidase n=1 Tax=Paenibacillus sp. ACRRX TaxID=2918206 RepID=UPI001EF688DB|nr:CPBP family intramembrane glutamic endopeptidase [Paenibacillus sp. ACRRX]MCG7409931.1 CPBP family intramembrane metalloprotease [Paenibacillus sp. ACRRX]
MFTQITDQMKAIIFTIVVLLLAVVFALLPNVNSLVYMLTPTLAALIMMFVFTRDGFSRAGWAALGLHRWGFRGYMPAFFIPLIIAFISFTLAWSCGLIKIQLPEQYGGAPWAVFPILILLTFVINVLTTSLGEELGWRGYWLPILVRVLGERRAYAANGIIHGLWHAPILLMTPIYHAEQQPLLAMLLLIVNCIALAPLIGSLRLRTNSIWPASILHTTHNLTWNVLMSMTIPQSALSSYISAENGLITVACYTIAASAVYYRIYKKTLFTQDTTVH